MAHSTYLVRCPYFLNETKKCISCEDVRRLFRSSDTKKAWMRMYCSSWEWEKCPWAADMTEAYYRYEKGDKMAVENHEIEALRKEIESLHKKLGRANNKAERQQAKIDDLRKANDSLTKVNAMLNAKSRSLHTKYKTLRDQREEYEAKIFEQVLHIQNAYEARLAYMMDRYAGGILLESEVKAWLKGKEFAIVAHDEDIFKVVFKDDDAGDEDGQTSEDIQEPGEE